MKYTDSFRRHLESRQSRYSRYGRHGYLSPTAMPSYYASPPSSPTSLFSGSFTMKLIDCYRFFIVPMVLVMTIVSLLDASQMISLPKGTVEYQTYGYGQSPQQQPTPSSLASSSFTYGGADRRGGSSTDNTNNIIDNDTRGAYSSQRFENFFYGSKSFQDPTDLDDHTKYNDKDDTVICQERKNDKTMSAVLNKLCRKILELETQALQEFGTPTTKGTTTTTTTTTTRKTFSLFSKKERNTESFSSFLKRHRKPVSWQTAATFSHSPVLEDYLVLPQPNFTNATTVVLVLSGASRFLKRQAIRETWGNGHDNVYFLVGHSSCPEEQDEEDGADNKQGGPTSAYFQSCKTRHHAMLLQEQKLYSDLIELPFLESYRSLPEKVVQGYQWTLQQLPKHVNWLVKVDDDVFVRVSSLESLLEQYNAAQYLVMGDIVPNALVAREGKWKEESEDYPHLTYPYWPRGASGHVVSRAVASYITSNANQLVRFQGEDVSIGIWMNNAMQIRKEELAAVAEAQPAETSTTNQQDKDGQATKKSQTAQTTAVDKRSPMGLDHVTFLHMPQLISFEGVEKCNPDNNPNYFYIIGHDMSVENQFECYEWADEIPSRPLVWFHQYPDPYSAFTRRAGGWYDYDVDYSGEGDGDEETTYETSAKKIRLDSTRIGDSWFDGFDKDSRDDVP